MLSVNKTGRWQPHATVAALPTVGAVGIFISAKSFAIKMSGERDDSPARVRELERRVAELERRVEALAQAFSRNRHQVRRPWLRPPLWILEQHQPKPLAGVTNAHDQPLPTESLPKIAIATPTLDRRDFLRATIDSVLGQNYPRLDYRIQDGGSTDGTQAMLADYGSRLSWHSGKDDGQAHAINSGLLQSDGEIMAYLNSDDLLMPGTLAYVAQLFKSRPEIDVVYGHRIFVDGHGREIGRAVLPSHDAKAIYWADYVPQETMFWRRRVWDAIGPFDEGLHYAFDWDFVLRAHKAGFKFLRAPRFLACFRVHDQQKVATMYDQGRIEMQEVRRRYLGHEPSNGEIVRRMVPYLTRQFAVHWLYRSRVLQY
ncbi:glycosyltransferase family 2 protein [Bradyrhizobium sp. 2TAF24]|uniref:glycosyltransferase family 2 protein n=1 Tax=Bradyrhizobium sp. 2TAF24 TaxID=3233011 RepID=UPI003F9145C6